ncbi:MAG: RsmB/NOP family class I SAM-dependent RNA methyltransferase [Bdellovibrionales bacterium]|nr:RsmB/NOP family class I SAM-dependent RNA methyltransferase [Bdellovibrionales bacterium]
MKYHHHLFQSCEQALASIFFEDRHADKCIEFYFKKNKKWGGRDRRFFAETVYDCVRWWSLYWQLVGKKASPKCFPILAASLWHRGVAIPDFDEFEGLNQNFFLKQFAEVKEAYVKEAFPYWLYQWGKQELGPLWDELVPYLNHPNRLVLRVNSQKGDRSTLIKDLKKEEIEAEPMLGVDSALIIKERKNVFTTKVFREGRFEVQDGSSQMVAPYLNVESGMRVIDACAGAGGKSLHIANLMQNKGKVIALDIHSWKLDELKKRARRNGISNIETRPIESGKTIKRLKASADRLILDVPCSGLGVLRRNPDSKWKLSEERLKELREIQTKILQDYSIMLKPGGLLLYSTCSILPSENEKQVENFLKNNSHYRLLKQRHIYPSRDGFDGFFMALLEKGS